MFIKNLGLMYGALVELADISLALQKADISLAAAHRIYVDRLRYLLPGKTHQVTIMHRHEGG